MPQTKKTFAGPESTFAPAISCTTTCDSKHVQDQAVAADMATGVASEHRTTKAPTFEFKPPSRSCNPCPETRARNDGYTSVEKRMLDSVGFDKSSLRTSMQVVMGQREGHGPTWGTSASDFKRSSAIAETEASAYHENELRQFSVLGDDPWPSAVGRGWREVGVPDSKQKQNSQEVVPDVLKRGLEANLRAEAECLSAHGVQSDRVEVTPCHTSKYVPMCSELGALD